MKLESLKVYARGSNGWGSSELAFAKSITQLYGPNGSGKTPLVQSIAFCLGYPCEFRDDIYVHCESVVLTVSLNGKIYKLKRQYSRELYVQVMEPTGTKQRFFKEGDYSRYLFEVFGYEFPHLVTNSNTHTHPYLSTILPIFYLDQDIGYTDFYKSPGSNFIRDQFSEAVRISVNLPSKNSFDKKKSAIDAKKAVERLDNKVQRLKGLYEDALNDSESVVA
ncbi:AAA family ATPase [Pseudoalteromonas sp. SYSU M81236]|uniref:AAA family ATPase n=1 Tax=Pseudoalteromonas sp. SYSU M81236 TaxID=3447014 RepID=UPI003F01F584